MIIGIGNIIRSDDGLGVHAVRRLREHGRRPDTVELVEGGTAGLLLLPHLAAARRAINIGAPAGTLVRLDPAERAFTTGMTPHDLGLATCSTHRRLAGRAPYCPALNPDPSTSGLR